MRRLMDKIGGRKLIGFFSCLLVGAGLSYIGKLDSTSAAYLAGLYAAFVGSNAATHLAGAVRAFAITRTPAEEAGDVNASN